MSAIGVTMALTVLTACCAGCAATRGLVSTSPASIASDSAIRAALAQEELLDASHYPPASVGVVPLRIIAADTSLAPLGHGLAELLMDDLSHCRQVVVVDRLRTQSLLRELRLTRLGIGDSAGPRLGRLLGARQPVVGQLMATGSTAQVDARLASSVDGTLVPVVRRL